MAYTTINKSSDYFNTLLYTGDGSSARSVTGVGFQPDWVWFKNRATSDHHKTFDAVRGANKVIYPNLNAVEATVTQELQSFNSDGFTVGTESAMNGNGNGIVAWNWKAGTTSGLSGGTITPSSYSISAASGLGIYKYTGTGSNGTIAHGLGTPPRFIIIKQLNDTANWTKYYNPITNLKGQEGRYVSFQTSGFSTASSAWNDTAATSSVFTVGTTALVNESGKTYIAYAFADITGFQKFCGWYVNANADGPFIYTGFKPAFFLMFNINNGSRFQIADNKRNPSNEIDKKIQPSTSNAEVTTGDIACDFLSNGIKIRGGSTSDINHTNLNMMYGLAIAEAPLVGSNNIPATAK
tara:strand:- start:73 stop:1128 length:1056 start_codon:yes stop_codon:yes gene_type:complete